MTTKTETMKDLTKIYIDLSKCSEEQIKSLVPALEKHGYNVYFHDRIFLKNGKYDRPYFHLFNSKSWLSSSILAMKEELTYPEFIRLFEGGDGESQTFTKEDIEKAYRAGENKQTYYFKDTTVILPTTYEGVDG